MTATVNRTTSGSANKTKMTNPSTGKNGTAGVLVGEHVFFMAISSARALMAEGTIDLKRRKKGEAIGSKSDTQSVASRIKGGTNDSRDGHLGPILWGAHFGLGSRRSRIKKSKKKSCKPMKWAVSICHPC
ncbi:hypothetical protein Ancab_019236, partial [Ancistrocladus abbreviatus]